jgi:membrane-bound ClpP family serine protease
MKIGRYTTLTIITTSIEVLALAAVVRLLLPRLGIDIPEWGIAILLTTFVAYNYAIYRICKNTQNKEALLPTQAMIGRRGITNTKLCPEGIVKVGSEKWRARAGTTIGKNAAIEVTAIEGFTLIVAEVTSEAKSDHDLQVY